MTGDRKMKTITYIMITAVLVSAAGVCFAEAKTDDSVEMIVSGNTAFAFDLYAQLKDEDGNLFFSPYSISTALAMTYAGAKANTAEQMAETMHFSRYHREFHPMFGLAIDGLNQQGKKGDYQLSIANALWAQKDYPFLDSFIDLNKQYYKAGLENVDFINETEKTRQQINQWVEDRTNEKIKDLIPEGVLNALTRLVLTNAIYFKGDWASQFDKDNTKDADFFISPDKTVTAPLMHQKEYFKYGQTDTLELLELPYKGDDLSMLVLLPKEKDGLAALEKELTAENLTAWQKRMYKKEVLVYLPKFKMTSEFSLNDTLKAMGMSDAFDQLKADFSGMDGTKNLYISAVLHKAFVEVNEEGTEAAAATGVVMGLRSMPAPPPVFRADHPFVFIIKDNNTDSILFVGRVTDPTAGKETTETTEAADTKTKTLKGIIRLKKQLPIPDDAVIKIYLEDVSRADASSTVIAKTTLNPNDTSPPYEFTLDYDPAKINQQHAAMWYTLRVRIEENGKLLFISDTHTSPFGPNAKDPVVVTVVPVGRMRN